jgi:hypothetical protein
MSKKPFTLVCYVRQMADVFQLAPHRHSLDSLERYEQI